MVDLLIAILISLGCNATSEATPEELRDAGVQTAALVQVFAVDGGGVVILETGGD